MSEIDLATIIETFYIAGLILAVSLGTYSAYWSLAIRHALGGFRYRKQALWVALVSLYFALEPAISYLAGPVPIETIPTILDSNLYFDLFSYFVSSVFVVVVLFVWADSAVLAARRSDPLLRDPFRWRRTRIFLWAVIVWNVVASVVALFSISSIASEENWINPTLALPATTIELISHLSIQIGSLPENPLADSFNLLVVHGIFIGFLPKYLVLGVAGAALVVGGFRSGDANFRSSLRWFGQFVAVFVVIALVNILVVFPFDNPLAPTAFNLAWGFVLNLVLVPLSFYFMYKTARALVALNRISAIEAEGEAGRTSRSTHGRTTGHISRLRTAR